MFDKLWLVYYQPSKYLAFHSLTYVWKHALLYRSITLLLACIYVYTTVSYQISHVMRIADNVEIKIVIHYIL